MRFLQLILSKIDDCKNLTQNIYTSITETDPDIRYENFSSDIIAKVEEIQIDLFKKLNYSVLEGEYINDNFHEVCEKVKTLIESFYDVPNTSFISDLNEEGRYSDFLINLKILYAFKACVIEYINTAKYIHRIFSEPQRNKNFVIDLSNTAQDILTELTNKSLEKILVKIFTENLFLSRKEFTLRNSDNDLQKLLKTKYTLKHGESDYPYEDDDIKTILYLLLDKNTFLIRKLIIRKYQDPTSQNHYYVLLGEENSFSLDKHPFITTIYQLWDKYSQKHFLSEQNEIYIRELLSFSGINLDTYWNNHKAIKHAKDVSKNISSLQNINFDKIVTNQSSFNSFAKKISENYHKNNILSLSVENEKEKISLSFDFEEFIQREQEKIDLIQSQSVISNFFPYKKVAFFIVDYIDYLVNFVKDNVEIDQDIIYKIETANKHLEQVTNKYRSALHWCKNHFYYSYQLPFEECQIKHLALSQEIQVFSPSTFSLPLNYSELLKEIDLLDNIVIATKNQINNLYTFSSLFERLDRKLTIQEKESENNKVKNIELLGIFSAIIALLFSGVTTAQSTEKFEFKFLTFITMFVILCSFLVLLRHFLYKKENTLKVLKWFSIYLLVIMSIIIITTVIFRN
ncbi:hypothetical protein [Flavobacterium sp. NRK1]|uniref:hypothetical protein n=1 Tax=Flavobacterium sp. NRK1 TaxID=2954929 RepID=UPI002092AEE3|nr:hypothetical protein [Flavobacterium sp. NRK1]MCO6147718.1 hypothetical protein [Flavobacterium sp. NRK1]